MCGLVGYWSGPAVEAEERLAVLRGMRERLRHRGPDASGEWVDPGAGLALGHRRLSILDLSEEGRQPMVSRGGRFVLAYNGEIYNFRSIRAELEARGERFRGRSDTEVALAAIERLGLVPALERFVGMFAFALFDRRERTLHLVRDRLGIKPLSWARGRDGTLLFGSELDALAVHPAFDRELDARALAAFLRYACVPAPHSIYRRARKVRPGTILRFSGPGEEPREETYWSALEALERGRARPFEGTLEEAAEALEAQLREAVAQRLVSDVPLGAFLSGGVDSSTVVALMQEASGRPVRTFSIGSERADYDESESAGRVAEHLGTEHTALVVGSSDALAVVERLPRIFDEPFADSSQIPTFLVSELARRHVTVALSGDGGDELFGGYNRHFWAPAVWRGMRLAPASLRRALSRGLTAVRPERWDRLFAAAGAGSWVRLPGQKVHKLAGALGARSAGGLYRSLCSHWTAPAELVVGAPAEAARIEPTVPGAALAERMMLTDMVTYLPDDILTKVDRASMAVSLEARVPILDHRVVELACRLPLRHKIQGRTGKLVLRRVLGRRVPPALWERPKMGFGLPIGEWLRGPLRPWAEELLSERRLREEGILRPGPIRRAWREHLEGRGAWQHHLWDVLMFQAWSAARRSPPERARGGGPRTLNEPP